VFCCALEVPRLLYGHTVLLGEGFGRVVPHTEIAVVALAILAGEGGITN
jgi:hypothetical protein